MKVRFIEASQDAKKGFNWGKFMVGVFDEEWEIPSALYSSPYLLNQCGWDRTHIIVFDLQTGEGGFFKLGGMASADLSKHRLWVCPMFEPFLTWLYEQDVSDLDALPSMVELPDAEPAFHGYRRSGENEAEKNTNDKFTHHHSVWT